MNAVYPEDWKSVRPIRFRSQIFGALEYVVMTGKVNIPTLAKHALELRNQREEKRLQALGVAKAIGPRPKDLHRQPYLTETEQLVRVLRSTGFITVKNGIVSNTDLARQLLDKKRKNELEADVFFMENLLRSRFVTYWLYLKRLFESEKVIIPKEYSKRDKKLRNYLQKQGFPLSVWSFYAIRDLFYDFALLNYIIDDEEERIFPLYTLDKTREYSYTVRIKSPEGYIYYWKRIEIDEFEEALVKAYLEIEGGWDRMGDIIELRERVSETLGISERQFNSLLSSEMTHPARIRIYPSIGALSMRKRRSYMTKFVSLPSSTRGYPLTLIRISRGGT